MKYFPAHPSRLRLLYMMRTNLSIAALMSIGILLPAQAENLDHVRQLLATRQCPNCELTSAGLVLAQLSGANLAGANLAGANLSQANLAGANLTGANLAGATLSGANLAGAKLTSANLQGTDLTRSYLVGADLTGTQIEMALIRGAIGLPTTAGTPEMFYQMAMEAGKRKQYEQAIENFNQVLMRKPDSAPAFIGRAMARLELGDEKGAIQDSEQAAALFERQGDANSAKSAGTLAQTLKNPPKARSGGGFGQALINVVGGLLQLFLAR